MSSPEWELHPQLARDTISIGNLSLCRILLMNDANYPWLLLVPRQSGLVELIDLSESAQALLMTEIARVSRGLRIVAPCDKLNIAAIGNAVPQLHVHIVARRRTDAAWPKPVWGLLPPLAYAPDELNRFTGELRRQFCVA
jgi:diadenosine tetraphosphate (Ap4A) HIT family hydrolase